jgi:hypothetical protein
MATIRIRGLNINAGGTPAISTFSDPWNNATNFTKNWDFVLSNYQTPVTANAGISAVFFISAGHLAGQYQGPAGPTYDYGTAIVPIPLRASSKVTTAQQQFVQVVFGSQAGANTAYCPAVFFSQTNDGSGTGSFTFCAYNLNFSTGLSPSIQRINFGVAAVNLLARGVLPIPAAADVWRLSADSTSGNVVLTTTVNGVQVNQLTDNSVNKLLNSVIFGYPALWALGGNTGDGITLTNFVGGVGL